MVKNAGEGDTRTLSLFYHGKHTTYGTITLCLRTNRINVSPNCDTLPVLCLTPIRSYLNAAQPLPPLPAGCVASRSLATSADRHLT
ncbi:hypothetical protein THAOC_19754 [Thalassiosira oceanica]|uniref:Uncharacterized protein n=1 Tax=Thalassiosira oceanica TaxID=159749 RepID=K0S1J9_THAOC|nr:hypothetical protein THAOC_19754 [Thalassiosira oceanica]|eukprot:EJK59968.1 hypothetical protein THAOC_19754 [Thalassiosira oceanica]